MRFTLPISKRTMLLVALTIFFALASAPSPVSVLQAQSGTLRMEREDLAFIRNLFNDKSYTFAKQEIEGFFKRYPESSLTPDVVFIQAQIDVIEGRFDQALRRYSRISSQFPESAVVEDALYFSGALKLQLNQPAGLVDFDRLLAKYPQSRYGTRILIHKGEQAFSEEKWGTAESHFNAVLKAKGLEDEQRVKAQNHLAWIHFFNGQILLAKSMFFELLESEISDGEKAKIAFQLGVEAQQSKRFKNAVSWFERQLREWPHPEFKNRSRFWIAECYYLIHKQNPQEITLEEKQKAIDLYNANLQLEEPVSPLVSRYHRGWLYNSMGQKVDAITDFAWLQQNSPEYASDLELTAIRAEYYEAGNKLADANRVYSDALAYHKEPTIRRMLLINIIRNAHTLRDCDAIISWRIKSELADDNPNAPEIRFYSGSCYVERREWEKAGIDFSGIPLDTQYARAAFPHYLEVFKKTAAIEGGLAYLSKVEKNPSFGNREKIQMLKIDLCLTLKQWAQAVEFMLDVEKEFTARANDPWFLLNIAKTADRVHEAFDNKKHPIHRYPLKKKSSYATLALTHYEKAYAQLPTQDKETRLSVLDILIARYKASADHPKVIAFYQEALTIISEKQRQAEIRLLIASIYLKDLKQVKNAQQELHKIHLAGATETHFESSSLLAELYVEQNKLIQAIKILEDLITQPIQNTKWFGDTHFRLGELYQSKERWQKALNHYEAVLSENRDDAQSQQARTRAEEIRKYLEQIK